MNKERKLKTKHCIKDQCGQCRISNCSHSSLCVKRLADMALTQIRPLSSKLSEIKDNLSH